MSIEDTSSLPPSTSDFASYEVSAKRRAFDSALLGSIDRGSVFVARHWLLLLNSLTALLTAMAFVAPVLEYIGARLPAQAIYFFYSFMCHQMPKRSYFIFGYQVAQCHRNTAIYGALFIGGVIFALCRARAKPLDWRLFTVLIAPMAVDGFTQLFGWRESNWELRTFSGALFGFACVWLVYPYLERFIQLATTPRVKVHRVVLYGKDGCSLCDKAKAILERLQPEYTFSIEQVDINDDPELMQRYQYLIPVIHIDGRAAAVSKVSEVWLRRTLESLG